jgi:pilus assembly protein CpaB
MRRGRIIIYLALLIVVIVALLLVVVPRLFPQTGKGTQQVSETQGPPPTPVETVDIIVVVQPIRLGSAVDASYLGTISFPRDKLVEGMYMTDMAEAVGRIARFDLEPGVILSKSYLADTPDKISATASEASFLIPQGMMAVSIPISRLSSVSYAPQRGDHVNVIVTLLLLDIDTSFQSALPNQSASVIAPGPALLLGLDKGTESQATLYTMDQLRTIAAQVAGGGMAAKQGRAEQDPLLEQTFYLIPSEAQRPRLVSQTLIQNVLVLQVGTFAKPEGAPKISGTEVEQKGTPTPTPTALPGVATQTTKEPDTITLVVTPQDAVALNYLLYSGAELTLALRSVGDNSTVETQAVTLQFLLEHYNIPIPVKLNVGIQPRVDDLVPPVLANDAKPTATGK